MGRITGIGHVAIRVKHLQRSAEFYEKLVGLSHIIASDGFHAFDVGGVHFCITPGRPKRRVEFDFSADDVEGLHRRLGEAGVDISKLEKDLPSGHVGFYFVDPDGHQIQVWSTHE